MAPTPQRSPWRGWRWKLAVVGLAALASAAAVWTFQQQQLQQRRQAQSCRELRQEITRFRKGVFDARLQTMRSVRLNTTQTATLRKVDANAFARYVAAYSDTVEQVAQAADQLAALVERYRTASCLNIQ
ncbi:MAG: hypothetical protein ACK46L_12290 [Synechococcaceae cyanobacterium]|jgi:hypothetical protein